MSTTIPTKLSTVETTAKPTTSAKKVIKPKAVQQEEE